MSGECEFPKVNASDGEISTILSTAKSIAVVGLSQNPERPSHWIAKYLIDHGFRVFGVNPGQKEILGLKIYPSLSDIPEKIDLANLFLRPEAVPPVVDEAIAKGVKAVWMQEGIVNNAAADKARAAGLLVVMNKCIYKEHAARA